MPSTAPLQYLTGSSAKAASVVPLTWGVTIISLVVILAIGLLLVGAIWHRPGLVFRPGEKAMLGEEKGGGAEGGGSSGAPPVDTAPLTSTNSPPRSLESVALRTVFGSKYWPLTLMKQLAGVRHAMFEPPKLARLTASFAQLRTPSTDRLPKSKPSCPWYMPLVVLPIPELPTCA